MAHIYIYIYNIHISGNIRPCNLQEISELATQLAERRKPRVVTKRLLGHRLKATLLGWLESGRNWSASGAKRGAIKIWRLENFRCTENSMSGWQTLEHVAANGAIVVGDISYIIWEIKHTEASGTGTISLVQMFFCSGVETGILNYHNFPMGQNVTSPSCYARMIWQFSQIQRPKSTQIWRNHQSSSPQKYPQVVQMKYVIQPKITIYIYIYGGVLKWGYPQIIHIYIYIAGSSMIIHPAIGVSPIETSIYSPPKMDAVAWNRLHWRHQHCRGGLDDLREHVDLEKTLHRNIWLGYMVQI